MGGGPVSRRQALLITLSAIVVAALLAGPTAGAASSALGVAKQALGLATKADKRSKAALSQASKPGPAGTTGAAGDTGPTGDRGASGQNGTPGADGQDGEDFGPALARYVATDPSPDTTMPPSGPFVTVLGLGAPGGTGGPIVTQFPGRVIAKAVLILENQDPLATPSASAIAHCLLEVGQGGNYELVRDAVHEVQFPVGFPEQVVVAGAITRPPGSYDVRVRCQNYAGTPGTDPDLQFELGNMSVWAVR